MTFNSQDFRQFIITGTLVNGKRFKPIYTNNWWMANNINLYRGNVWGIRNHQPGRILLKRVTN